MTLSVRRLGSGDVAGLRAMNRLYRVAFDDEAHDVAPPSHDYARRILSDSKTIALVAEAENAIVGALTAYVLPKLEQERSEIYLYDLAVAETHRRRGIATALIDQLRRIARESGCWMIFVQADRVDEPAVALYDKVGLGREEPLHFDIEP